MRQRSRFTAAIAICILSACNQHSEAEDAVRQYMMDPDATQFRDVSTCPDDPSLTSGEYNSKNGYGAYVGFKSFYYTRELGPVFSGDEEFGALIGRCYGNVEMPGTADEPANVEMPSVEDVEASLTLSEDPPADEGSTQSEAGTDLSSECFGDYCPCDTGDPDYGGADVPLCRSLEQGVPVDDQMMAAAAGLRDARRQLREFEEQEGEF